MIWIHFIIRNNMVFSSYEVKGTPENSDFNSIDIIHNNENRKHIHRSGGPYKAPKSKDGDAIP